MKQHDRQSTMSGGSRSMARDPQERSIQGYQPTGKLDTSNPPRGGDHTNRTLNISSILADGHPVIMPDHGELTIAYPDTGKHWIEYAGRRHAVDGCDKVLLTFHAGRLQYISRHDTSFVGSIKCERWTKEKVE